MPFYDGPGYNCPGYDCPRYGFSGYEGLGYNGLGRHCASLYSGFAAGFWVISASSSARLIISMSQWLV